MIIERVQFYSEGARLSGFLYLPSDRQENEKRRGIVLCHGFSGIKELILPQYAKSFAESGFAVLSFDYRGFGESDGQRGRIIWQEQIADIRNAVTYITTRPEVDEKRIGLWGTSYGGALAPYAFSLDERAKVCVGQLGFSDGYSIIADKMQPDQLQGIQLMIEQDRQKRVLHNDPSYADPMILSGDRELADFFNEAVKDFPQLEGREVMVQFLEAHMEFSPIDVIRKKGDRPLMLIAAELDLLCPVDEYKKLFEAAPEPKKWLVFEKTKHFEFYSGEQALRSASEAVQYFKEYL